MTKHSGRPTVNSGGASKPTRDEAAAEFEIGGNVAGKGEEPSPGKRERGEKTSADTGSPVDLDSAHDRAS
jgi:hypothetical protein